MKWEGKYCFDKVFNTIWATECSSIFIQLSDAIEWILAYDFAISFVDKILDNFSKMEPMSLEPASAHKETARLPPVFPDFSDHEDPAEREQNAFCMRSYGKSKCEGRNRLDLKHCKLALHHE